MGWFHADRVGVENAFKVLESVPDSAAVATHGEIVRVEKFAAGEAVAVICFAKFALRSNPGPNGWVCKLVGLVGIERDAAGDIDALRDREDARDDDEHRRFGGVSGPLNAVRIAETAVVIIAGGEVTKVNVGELVESCSCQCRKREEGKEGAVEKFDVEEEGHRCRDAISEVRDCDLTVLSRSCLDCQRRGTKREEVALIIHCQPADFVALEQVRSVDLVDLPEADAGNVGAAKIGNMGFTRAELGQTGQLPATGGGDALVPLLLDRHDGQRSKVSERQGKGA